MLIENKNIVIEDFLKQKHESDLVGLVSNFPHLQQNTKEYHGIYLYTCGLIFYTYIYKKADGIAPFFLTFHKLVTR